MEQVESTISHLEIKEICPRCEGGGFIMIPVCCGNGSIYGCCGDPDPYPEGCDDCQATGFIRKTNELE